MSEREDRRRCNRRRETMSKEQSEPSAGGQAGMMMVDVLALPDELRTIVTWLMRQGEAGLPDLAGKIRTDRRKRTLTLTAHQPSAANQTTSVLCWLLGISVLVLQSHL